MSEREDAARRLLRELLHEALGNSGGNGQPAHDAPAAVPAPPVAAVLRPSTWDRPPVPGEVIGDGAARATTDARTEHVTLESDEDLDRFVRSLLARSESDGAAIRAGRLRFSLGRSGPGAESGGGGALRIERGAVTERTVKEAAAKGARLVLAPGAVLTPLAREKARALGIEIERERRC
jgi:hypothetical protein